jgi:hypothetical protein
MGQKNPTNPNTIKPTKLHVIPWIIPHITPKIIEYDRASLNVCIKPSQKQPIVPKPVIMVNGII